MYEYEDGNGGIRKELRESTDVFDADSLASFTGAAMTNDHPEDEVTPETWKEHAVGTVLGPGRRENDHVAVSMVVHDAKAIAAIEKGKRELSVGYTVTIDDTPGVHPTWGRYDVRQTKITVNHLAIVDRGRAGPAARMRVDGARAQVADGDPARVSADPGSDLHPGNRVSPSLQMDLTQALAALAASNEKIGALTASNGTEKARADKAEAVAKTEKGRADKAENDLVKAEESAKAEKARADKAETARVDAEKSVTAKARARLALEAKASVVLGAESKVDAMTDRQIYDAVVEKIDGEKIAAERGDAYAEARFDGAMTRSTRADAALGATREEIVAGRASGAREDAADEERKASDAARIASRTAYRQTIDAKA